MGECFLSFTKCMGLIEEYQLTISWSTCYINSVCKESLTTEASSYWGKAAALRCYLYLFQNRFQGSKVWRCPGDDQVLWKRTEKNTLIWVWAAEVQLAQRSGYYSTQRPTCLPALHWPDENPWAYICTQVNTISLCLASTWFEEGWLSLLHTELKFSQYLLVHYQLWLVGIHDLLLLLKVLFIYLLTLFIYLFIFEERGREGEREGEKHQ